MMCTMCAMWMFSCWKYSIHVSNLLVKTCLHRSSTYVRIHPRDVRTHALAIRRRSKVALLILETSQKKNIVQPVMSTESKELKNAAIHNVVLEMSTNQKRNPDQNHFTPDLSEDDIAFVKKLQKNPHAVNEVIRIQNHYRAKKAMELAQAIRENKMKTFENEIMKHSPLRQTCFYAFFLLIYSLAVFLRVDGEAMYFSRAIHEHVVEEEFLMSDASVLKTFDDVANEDEFWQYLSGPFAANMFPDTQPEIFPGSVLVNTVRMRQIRVQDFGNSNCFVPPMLKKSFNDEHCYPEWKSSAIDTAPQMKPINLTKSLGDKAVKSMSTYFKNKLEKAFQYDLESFRRLTQYEAWKNAYPGRGGYIMDINATTPHDEVVEVLNNLRTLKWIDGGTRGVFVELALYNKQSSIFVNVRLLFEFYATGGCGTYPSIEVAKINQFGTETQQSKLRAHIGTTFYTLVVILTRYIACM